jgi:hypothetical protein
MLIVQKIKLYVTCLFPVRFKGRLPYKERKVYKTDNVYKVIEGELEQIRVLTYLGTRLLSKVGPSLGEFHFA